MISSLLAKIVLLNCSPERPDETNNNFAWQTDRHPATSYYV